MYGTSPSRTARVCRSDGSEPATGRRLRHGERGADSPLCERRLPTFVGFERQHSLPDERAHSFSQDTVILIRCEVNHYAVQPPSIAIV
jgi:hypothetical protein